MPIVRMLTISFVALMLTFSGLTAMLMGRLISRAINTLEMREAEADAIRVVQFFDEVREQLANKASDWSVWDNSWNFAMGGQRDFVKVNMEGPALANLDVNLIGLVSLVKPELSIALSRSPEVEDSKQNDQLLQAFTKVVPPLVAEDRTEGVSGFATVDGKPWIYAVQPILKSDGSGPQVGSMYFARQVSDDLIQRASMRLKQVIKIKESSMSSRAAPNVDSLGEAFGDGFMARIYPPHESLRETDIDILATSELDSQSGIVWSMQSSSDRPLHRLGVLMSNRTIGLVLGLTALGWFIFAAVAWILLIKPLARLQAEIATIEEIRPDTIQRFELLARKGVGEEVSQITVGLARMMQRVQKAESDRDAARTTMLHSNKMASLGEMAGGIAHEINNPLAVLRGLSHNLRKLLSEERVDKSKEQGMLNVMDKTITRIVQIVKAMKIHSRNTIDLSRRVRPAELLESILTLCRDQLRAASIELRISCEADLPEIACDEVQIGQVILNLVQNAIDAVASLSQEHRWIDISISTDTSGERLKMIFANGGPTIPEDSRQRLFQPFFTTKPVGQGTGLGLSISASILRAHYGRIDFDGIQANPTFVVQLPVQGKMTDHSDSKSEAA